MSATLAKPILHLGPTSASVLLTPEEFDAAEFEEGWRYELINEVLVVSPTPLRQERDPTQNRGFAIRLEAALK